MAGYLDRFAAEASGEPFVLIGPLGRRVEIPRPAAADVLHARSWFAEIRALCADQLDDLLELVGGEPYEVLLAVVEDLKAHHGFAGVGRLRWLLDRYGEHLEADLLPRGIDILDLWRDRVSPRTLLNLIDHLPRTSHYQQALAQDDEVVAGLVDLPAGQPPASPPLTEFSPEVELLADVFDRLGELGNAVIASAGGKPRQVKPRPRPVTAIDRCRAHARRAAQDALEAVLFPHRTA